VFRLALRQTEGLIGSVIRLLGLDLPVPDHTTLSRRAATLEVPRPRSSSSPDAGSRAEPLHLLESMQHRGGDHAAAAVVLSSFAGRKPG
jgi:hypothetical protein